METEKTSMKWHHLIFFLKQITQVSGMVGGGGGGGNHSYGR